MGFRKKKVTGTVTIFGEGDENAAERFDDLHLDGGNDPLEAMTVARIEKAAICTAIAGKESTARALQVALETREIGINTATKMHEQTEQLERMGQDFEVVHDYLDKSEKVIDKMRKPLILRLFQLKKKAGRCLDEVRTNDRKEREELRRNGVESMSVNAVATAKFESMDDLASDDGDSGKEEKSNKRNWIKKKKKNNGEGNGGTRAVTEDYSEYSDGIGDVLRQQDDDLDLIGDVLSDMKNMAHAMNNELDCQSTLITEVQNFTEVTSERTKANARKIEKIN